MRKAKQTASLNGGLTLGTTIPPYDGQRDSAATPAQTGTSIFDPVLCEIAYRWFCPPGGLVLDPFAGGSVRGIVAAYLGRRYIGVDLSERQCEANRVQHEAIFAEKPPADPAAPVSVKISAAMARLKFNGCDPDYIRDVCHASCCQSSAAPGGTLITIHPSEQKAIEARGGIVEAGLLQSIGKRCPFKSADDLCGLHFTPDKPFGCIASPFTLTQAGTLIVRNRYKMLKCYDDGRRQPAYKAFRASLDLIFGPEEAARIDRELDAGGGDLMASMSRKNYDMLRDNDAIKRGELDGGEPASAEWIAGDSRQALPACEADFVFSCPPYADLERYSDDPADISTMDYPAFREAYFDIIKQACARLKPDSFAAFVVGEVRDKRGHYVDFIGDTVQAFRDAGLEYYNEGILITAVGSLPIRVGRQFSGARKLGKTHQNVLVFVKGSGKRAAERCGPVEVDESLFDAVSAAEGVMPGELSGLDVAA